MLITSEFKKQSQLGGTAVRKTFEWVAGCNIEGCHIVIIDMKGGWTVAIRYNNNNGVIKEVVKNGFNTSTLAIIWANENI